MSSTQQEQLEEQQWCEARRNYLASQSSADARSTAESIEVDYQTGESNRTSDDITNAWLRTIAIALVELVEQGK